MATDSVLHCEIIFAFVLIFAGLLKGMLNLAWWTVIKVLFAAMTIYGKNFPDKQV